MMLPVVTIDSHALAAPSGDGLGERLRRDFIEMVERYEAPPSGQGR